MQTDLFEFYNKIEEAIIEISFLPDIMQTLIDRLDLDNTNLSEDAVRNIGQNAKQIYAVLSLAQYRITDLRRQLYEIYDEAKEEALSSEKPAQKKGKPSPQLLAEK